MSDFGNEDVNRLEETSEIQCVELFDIDQTCAFRLRLDASSVSNFQSTGLNLGTTFAVSNSVSVTESGDVDLEREWDELLNAFQIGGEGPHHPIAVTASRSNDRTQFCATFPASRGDVPIVSIDSSTCGPSSSSNLRVVQEGSSSSYSGMSYEVSVPITVFPVNDNPRWNVPRVVASGGTENTVMRISGVSVHDDDSIVLGEDALVLRITISSQYGQIRVPLQGDEEYVYGVRVSYDKFTHLKPTQIHVESRTRGFAGEPEQSVSRDDVSSERQFQHVQTRF